LHKLSKVMKPSTKEMNGKDMSKMKLMTSRKRKMSLKE